MEELEDGFAVYVDDDGGERELRRRFPDATSAPVAAGWEDAWRAFHRGVRVGRLWVGPPWETPPTGALPVVIDPGRAFGTGGHPTTRLALELLQELEPASLLDVGCGSGVLAIAAAKLGFAPVSAIDVDEAAVEATVANAAENGAEVSAALADALADPLPEADVAVANVALGVVEALALRLESRLLVASGYLERDEPRLDGWRLRARRTADGWAADLLEREWRGAAR
ncbi:MAG: 50S ribosomal protein L11 methyltransferase [Thermoleophilia bacterium]|nr:50S ribosomal protein L11 methyltransferase [Thermoleophilia bacterium]